ncbi:NAD(P)/FAD-dependent oxidoreductase [Desulfosporosinus sp. BICA1-9]|uniref:NAD(P)/FAD-dependent oxidoreductase n=1 Tax=Desulfosporosinus sp. BICA1-9 TaxID=1531958 RepID=UPI00054B4EC5|nr:FAD-dependent oxidoreductase [Desulfosporosinus sp. BICA1-9]KJS49396.1 MAG: pyridine nucleotide-disulfide oxidoreductase [Peptococcaceae bacterium BRH_c23]KJS89196.1 MAG: pyridine nucleotide-disulfide oxidoreductase [Desulfosporosinus sp. BICA1-9]HBW37951.1 NAD(P)/FAD-dependent oxidoreductase [Desulfosporosinus sp.]
MRYLIIGNSAAGVFAAETIRGLDPEGQITMISNEDYSPYSRCLTSYFLGKEIPEEMMYIRNKDFYSETGIDFQAGYVERVDADSKNVLLDSGEKVNYDKLLIATGSSPFNPPLEGSDIEGIFELRTLDDAKAMAEFAPKVKAAVVMGAGLVGLKGAHGLHELGINVTIIGSAPRVMRHSIDEESAEILTRLLEEDGYRVLLNTKVVKVLGEEDTDGRMSVSGVLLNTGEQIPCQMIIRAVGVRPNVKLVSDSGISVNYGIIVDEEMQTSEKDIYAAGDVAEALDLLSGEKGVSALWPTATEQGIVAGCNMAGVKREYHGSLALNSAVISGVGIVSVGLMNLPPREGSVIRASEPDKNFYRKFVIKEGRLVGMIMVGDIEGAGILSGLIRKRAKVDVNYLHQMLVNPIDYPGYLSVVRGGQ